MLGFAYEDAVQGDGARKFPKTSFAIVDMSGRPAQLRRPLRLSREQETLSTVDLRRPSLRKTGTVGFVGDMDIPLILGFACGYVQNAKAGNAAIKVIQNKNGNARRPPGTTRARLELAMARILPGADIVYAAPVETGLGDRTKQPPRRRQARHRRRNSARTRSIPARC